MASVLYFAKTITPLHVGCGRSASTDIDLPVARERLTNWPVIPGSGVKGSLRGRMIEQLVESGSSYADADRDPGLLLWFGKTVRDTDGEGSQAGSLVPTDLRLVVLGVRSFFGGYAYVVCPLSLSRLAELAEAVGNPLEVGAFTVGGDARAIADNATKIADPSNQDRAYLEGVDLIVERKDLKPLAAVLAPGLGRPAEQVASQLMVVSDTTFTFFTETATEVLTKVSLDPATKSARDGMLRTEEAVPCESLFAGVLSFERVKGADPNRELAAFLHDRPKFIRFGGKATTGHGICRLEFVGGSQ